ncbi:MAG: flagellar protein FliS [Chloroflexi bacterium]|nr:flagellar protein FliS [Chloroflexota bacterium]
MAVAYSNNGLQLNSYRTNSVLGLTPGELVLKLYDMGLSALSAGDQQRATRVLAQLIEGLDFRYHDIAFGLFRLYRYCMDETKKGEYDVPTRILRELRETWAQALRSPGGAAS